MLLRVTIDSNVLDRDVERMRKACEGLAVELAPTTVTLRVLLDETEIDYVGPL